MYIAQAFNILHDWWRYLVGLIIIILAWQLLGAIPLGIAIFAKVFSEGGDFSQLEANDMLSMLEPNLNLFLLLLMFAIGLIAVLLVSKYLHKQSLTHLTTSRKKIDWKRFWFIFILWGVVSSSFVLIDYFLIAPEDYELNFKTVPFLILCIIAIIMVPMQTSFEEYLFRGYLMQGLGVSSVHQKFPFTIIYTIIGIVGYIYFDSIYNFGFMEAIIIFILLVSLLVLLLNTKNLTTSSLDSLLYKVLKRNSTPLILTSVVFGLLHIANPEVEQLGYVIMVYYIGTGLFLGIITLMDEGMELALGFHAANNLFTALLVTADWTAFQTHSVLKDMSDPEKMGIMEIFVPVFVIFPILLFILSKKYKWNNWKDKLFGPVLPPTNDDYKILEDIETN
ncbi:CPBP family intramembrane glutamic endopeptidase [Seonamhaeicola sp. ML3]|uniref:CPBP family intramembrane glutamic endopeptidase n=1 Tax=Seonamhaeicola sp. ML3 TaxID=2937786 RepID=UPI00200CB80D|nr:CPBP family intramembrane glutamic endopeptidase [Seonamhaeicola sp. ML3]